MSTIEENDLIGCCGLYCGLCTKFQSKAKSRCIGCKLGEQHSWCSIWKCCVKKRGYEICTECAEMLNCEIHIRREVMEWIPAAENLHQIQESGLEKWLEGQKERQALVEELLRNHNEGRSMKFYCSACSRMPIDLIKEAIVEAKRRIVDEKVAQSDIKSKAKITKGIIKEMALLSNINLS